MRRDYRPGLRHWHDELPDLPVALKRSCACSRPAGRRAHDNQHRTVSSDDARGHSELKLAWMAKRLLPSDLEIGYLHRNFEKNGPRPIPIGESCHTQIVSINMSAFMNGVGYCMAVEKMMNCEGPGSRQSHPAMILSELSRRNRSSGFALGTNLGRHRSVQQFLVQRFEPRERVYSLFDKCAGGRIFAAYNRIGGFGQRHSRRFCRRR